MIGDVYSDLDVSFRSFPADTAVDPTAYKAALDLYERGDAAIIFTPDDTHFQIALDCVERGLHVLICKPAVQTLGQHYQLHEAALRNRVLVAVEVHKRWDPIYVDARDRIKLLGPFSYIYSYMSQPKVQLETFKQWAGLSSDISYYLNTHHIDFHEWAIGHTSRPIRVIACAATGVAQQITGRDCEDTITLTVTWQNMASDGSYGAQSSLGTAVYTASWIAPQSDVHSQQRFFYMGHKGEVTVDQAHRGYSYAADMTGPGSGFKSLNPLFMKYTPTDGQFSGQNGYGYRCSPSDHRFLRYIIFPRGNRSGPWRRLSIKLMSLTAKRSS